MKKRELSVLIATGLTASFMLNNVSAVKAEDFTNKTVSRSSEDLKESISSEIIGVEDKIESGENSNTEFPNEFLESESSTQISEESMENILPLNDSNQEDLDFIYLSDIEYDKSKTKASVQKDTNIAGGTITLIVDGEGVQFKKGIGAHATSTVVYDLRNYKDKFSRFISYMGVDKSKNGWDNGVDFSIYTSDNGVDWDLVKNVGVVTSATECAYVDIDISNANYLKLYAHDNGNSAFDHAVYGDAKLATKSYGGHIIDDDILMNVSEYDEILRNNSIDKNIKNNELTILRRDFVNKVGYDNLKRLASQNPDYNEAIRYLLEDITALRYFIVGGPVNNTGSYTGSIKFFSDIYKKYASELKSGSEDNFHLRLATSIALAYGKEDLSRFWLGNPKTRNSVKRYEVYKTLISSGIMNEGGATDGEGKWTSNQFKELPVPLMRWVVGNRISDEEIMWLAEYALKEKNNGKNYLSAYNYIEYTSGYTYDRPSLYDPNNYEKYNQKYNFGKYFDDYGTEKLYRLWMVFEEGSVCGGLAKTYSNLANTFGRPSSVVGQPGHAATITYAWSNENKRYEWIIQNNISGWVESGNEYGERMLGWGTKNWSKGYSASYAVVATDALKDYDEYVKSVELNILAEAYNDVARKKEAYLEALKYKKINVDSIEGLINTYKNDSNTTSTDYFELGKKIIDTYTYYPQAMVELLNLLKSKVTIPSEAVELDLLENKALLLASKVTINESSCVYMTKQLAEKYLGNMDNELASFSFDGDKAGKIVINPKYEGSQIRVRYSFDGGVNWYYTDDHEITLTPDQLASINSTQDIKVGLVGTEEVFVIDILDGKVISNSTIYKNDLENLLIGDTENLEISFDDGNTWCDYVSDLKNGMRITGNQTVKARYKAYGHYLTGNSVDYTFNEDANTPEKTYVELKNIKLEEHASQNNATIHAAANILDGNYNTGWHTLFRHKEPEKFITVSFDKIRNITALEYWPSNGYNGLIKSAKIQTSFDGKNWVDSGTITNLPRTKEMKVLSLDKPTQCKYLKLIATETYGNSSGEIDMYLSGNMLNFFEDTRESYSPEASIDYSTTDITNKDVTATVVLPKGCTIVGNDSHVFDSNGTFEFEFLDAENTKHTIEAKVDWIDKEAPTARVEYDIEYWTSEKVTATLVDVSEEVTFINGNSYTFEDNGTYTFEYEDKAGNKGSVTAEVNWISKSKPNEVVIYSKTEETNKPVKVSLQVNLDEVEILNNDGKPDVVFYKNGEFIFELMLKNTGYKFTIPVKVDWINDSALDTDESEDMNGSNNNDNSNGLGPSDDLENNSGSSNSGGNLNGSGNNNGIGGTNGSSNSGTGSNNSSSSGSNSSNGSNNTSKPEDINNSNNNGTGNGSCWSQGNDNSWEYYKDGKLVKNEWVNDNSWYYLNEYGKMVIGWHKISDSWYYFNLSGAMQTSWIQDNGQWYYLKSSGEMAKGWVKDNNKWYYLNESGAMATGWVKENEKWYHLKESGEMTTGWVKDNGKWYYLKESGEMVTGWIKDNSKWYYLKESGEMAKGWVKDKDKWYYLNESGAMLSNTTVNGYVLGTSGEWIK